MENHSREEYLVVEFPEEMENDTVPMAIISSNWIFYENGGLYCYWPSYLKSNNQRQKAVLNHVELLTKKCTSCAIVVKFSSDDYMKANMKLKLLEEESSSQSEREPTSRHKPNRFSEYTYESELTDIEDNDDIPAVPKLPEKTYTTLKPLKPTKDRVDSHLTASSNISQLISSQQSKNMLSDSFPNQTNLTSLQCANDPNIHTSRQSSAPSFSSSSHSRSQPSDETLRLKHCSCQKNEVLLNELVRKVEMLRTDLQYLINISGERNRVDNVFEEFPQFSDIDSLTKFNQDLKDDENFSKACCKFSLVGGKDFAETTRKILAKIISHQLALHMNWSGRNDKGGFKQLENVVKLIHVSVRKNPLAKNATGTDIENTIKVWLRNAPDREGGRSKRNKANALEEN